jgi:hypothetical protein
MNLYISLSIRSLYYSHKLEYLVDERPLFSLSLRELHPLQRELSEYPFAPTMALAQVILFNAVASVTVEVAALFMHHFPD